MMQKILLLMTLTVVWCGQAWSAETVIPNVFKTGDVVTAEALNESFAAHSHLHKNMSATALMGEWRCDAVSPRPEDALMPYAEANGWVLGVAGITLRKSVLLTFKTSNGIATLTSDAYNPFSPLVARPQIVPAFKSPFEVVAGGLYFQNEVYLSGLTGRYQREVVRYDIKVTARDEITLTPEDYASQATLKCRTAQVVPANPTDLKVNAVSNQVEISWRDNSPDEDAFVVLRKREGEAVYTETSVTQAETALCSERLPAGTYYYQVKARNAYGDSAGSNVVRVVVK